MHTMRGWDVCICMYECKHTVVCILARTTNQVVEATSGCRASLVRILQQLPDTTYIMHHAFLLLFSAKRVLLQSIQNTSIFS